MIHPLILSITARWPIQRGRDRSYRFLADQSWFPELLGEAGDLVVVRGGFLVACQSDDRVSNWIKLYREYEIGTQDYILRHLDTGKLFCDIGANVGYFGLLAAHSNPDQQVWAFEPNPAPRSCLETSVEANEFGQQMRVLPYGCSEEEGDMQLIFEEGISGSGYLGGDPAPSEGDGLRRVDVKTMPLDSLLESAPDSTPPVGLVKIDVEGHEVQVLKGMLATLTKDRPRVILEVVEEQLERAGTSSDELYELMKGLGYVVEERFDLNVGFCPA